MITSEGWLDWAERVPGPSDKKYTQINAAGRYIPHSAVGFYNGWASRLFSPERDALGRYTLYAAASVHLWIPQAARAGKLPIIQHYPFTVSCWASGNREANTNGIAAENEGGYNPVNEPLTEFQIEMNIQIIKELSSWKGWQPARPTAPLADATLLEHNECVLRWGGGGTACPSKRIPWPRFLKELAVEEEEMTFIGIGFLAGEAKNYELYVGANGRKKRHILNPTERKALEKHGYIRKAMTAQELNTFTDI